MKLSRKPMKIITITGFGGDNMEYDSVFFTLSVISVLVDIVFLLFFFLGLRNLSIKTKLKHPKYIGLTFVLTLALDWVLKGFFFLYPKYVNINNSNDLFLDILLSFHQAGLYQTSCLLLSYFLYDFSKKIK